MIIRMYDLGSQTISLQVKVQFFQVYFIIKLIKLMKQHSQQKHSEILNKKMRGGQTTQFQIFKDEHFLKHKKEQSLTNTNQPRIFISSNVLQYKPDPRFSQLSAPQKNNINFRTQTKSSANTKNQVHFSQQLNPQLTKIQIVDKEELQPRLQRYGRVTNSEIKVWGQVKPDYQVKYSNQKIGILKKIIQHYNIKSMQKSFESNLMSKQSINHNSQSPVKNKFVSIKKVIPKSAVRRQTATRNDFTRSKLKGYLNLQGLNLLQNYLNPTNFQVEAQSIKDLIKDCQENRSRLNKTVKQTKKERQPRDKKSSIPGHVRTKGHKFETLPTEKFKTLENLTDNCINIKINKFKEFIFMINFAHKVYRELDIPKYMNNFKIFIGKGNNCNLIKAIMKRRFWFQVTKNIEEANFVWTQLKQQSIYEKQNLKYELKKQQQDITYLQTRQSRTEQSLVISKNTINQQNQEEYLSLKNLTDKSIDHQLRQRKDLKSRKYRERNTTGYQPQRRILTKQQIQSQRQLIDEIMLRKRTYFNDRIKYLKGFNVIQFQHFKDELIHNHLTLNGLLGNKKAMFYMLRQYYNLIGKNVFQTVPLTFHIKKGFLDDQYKQFMIKFTQNKNLKMPNYWIIKPGQFSNRGQGISCTNKLEDIRGRVGALRNTKNKSIILQQYITRPLLYNGRKFDIRTYMLVTINNGKLRGYWYQDGYVRTSSYTWTLQEITDNYIHLTNDAIQKYSSNYGKFQPGNKLTYSQLQRYLDNLQKNSDKDYNFQTEIYPKIKQIATDAIKSSFCFIDPSRKGNNFEIFGFDFMIDNDFKPWLIQINTNPCLEMNCPVLDRIIPSMVQNAFRIGLDSIIPPPMNYSSTYKYSIPENALHYNKFEVIFDEQRDGAALHELYANNNVIKMIDEYEQDKQIYEEEGQEITLDQPC